MINLEPIGRLEKEKLLILGSSSDKEWVHIFRGVSYITGIESSLITEKLDSSDQASFHEASIPAAQLFSGANLDFHRPTDSAEKIDYQGLVKITKFTKETIEYLANR